METADVSPWPREMGWRERHQVLQSRHCMYAFYQKCPLHLDPELELYGDRIPVVDEIKFLDLIFDGKLTLQLRLKYLKAVAGT